MRLKVVYSGMLSEMRRDWQQSFSQNKGLKSIMDLILPFILDVVYFLMFIEFLSPPVIGPMTLTSSYIFDPRNFASKLLDWKEHGFPGLGDSSGCGLGQMTKAVLQSTGYVLDPITVSREVWERSGRKNAANGAIMRTAIAGIPYFWDLGIVEKNAVDMCLTTHADPRCVTSCVIVSLIIALILQEKNNGSAIDVESIINTSRETGVKYLPTSEDQEDLLHHTDSANDLSSLCLDETGKIGFTYKCLGVGLWALRQAQRGEGFPEIIQHITREGGDADTNCAVAGALVGVYLGFSQLPQSWLKIMPYEVWLDGWVQKILFVLHLL